MFEGWQNKCLQTAVLSVLDDSQAALARTSLQALCSNDSMSCGSGARAGRLNLWAVERVVRLCSTSVQVLLCESLQEFSLGHVLGCWLLGARDWLCAGTLLWCAQEMHVEVCVDAAVIAFGEALRASGCCAQCLEPWWVYPVGVGWRSRGAPRTEQDWMQDFPAFLRWLDANWYVPNLVNFEDFEEKNWALWFERLRASLPVGSVFLARVEKAVADVRARQLREVQADSERRAVEREAQRAAALREEEVQRTVKKYADTSKERWAHLLDGLQKWVGREEVLPRFGGVLPGEAKWVLWIEVVRRRFLESDDLCAQLEQFLADAKVRLAAAAKRKLSSAPVEAVSLEAPEDVNVSVEVVGCVASVPNAGNLLQRAPSSLPTGASGSLPGSGAVPSALFPSAPAQRSKASADAVASTMAASGASACSLAGAEASSPRPAVASGSYTPAAPATAATGSVSLRGVGKEAASLRPAAASGPLTRKAAARALASQAAPRRAAAHASVPSAAPAVVVASKVSVPLAVCAAGTVAPAPARARGKRAPGTETPGWGGACEGAALEGACPEGSSSERCDVDTGAVVGRAGSAGAGARDAGDVQALEGAGAQATPAWVLHRTCVDGRAAV